MPFPQQEPSQFSRSRIELLKPGQYGVYGIFRPDLWIYVGRGDIRSRLLDHLNGDNLDIMKHMPTDFVAVVTDAAELWERRLILECKPVANQAVSPATTLPPAVADVLREDMKAVRRRTTSRTARR